MPYPPMNYTLALKSIADLYGCEPNSEDINRSVYKNTACGAWAKFDLNEIQVGTIVEGQEAEHFEVVYAYDSAELLSDKKGVRTLVQLFRDALERCEDFCDEHFEGVE